MKKQTGQSAERAADLYAGVTLSHSSIRGFAERFLDIESFRGEEFRDLRALVAEMCAYESELAWREKHPESLGGEPTDFPEPMAERTHMRDLAARMVLDLVKHRRTDVAVYLTDSLRILRSEFQRSGRIDELIANPYFSSLCGPQS